MLARENKIIEADFLESLQICPWSGFTLVYSIILLFHLLFSLDVLNLNSFYVSELLDWHNIQLCMFSKRKSSI